MRAKAVLAWIVVAIAVAAYFMAPPAGFDATMMHAAALVILAVGLWAVNAFPEYLTGLVFLVVAMLLAIAPANVVFSGFASTTLWLVFGGLFMAEAVRATGLGERLAHMMLDRFTADCGREPVHPAAHRLSLVAADRLLWTRQWATENTESTEKAGNRTST